MSAVVAPSPRVERLDPLAMPGWDAAIASLPGVSFFHTSAWLRVLHETYRFRALAFVERHPESLDTFAAALPLLEVDSWLTGRRGISLPFTDECEPLATDHAAARRLFRAVSDFGRERHWRHWEIRGGTSALGAPASVGFHGHRLALSTDPAWLFSRCDSAVRRAVRKAEQARLTVTFAHDLETTRAFHSLVCQTRHRHGVPPQPLRFFENIQRHVLARRQGCIVLARLGELPVAGAMFLHFGESAVFKFGASNDAFRHLRPNNLVMWRAIEWHARAGFSWLDFGRTSLGNDGLRRFKLGWGATERHIAYARYDRRSSAFVTAHDHSSGWHNNLFRIVPLAVARLLGNAAYKHVA